MTGWVDPRDPALSPVIALARELSDPIRLTALQLLAVEGPHTMSQLADVLGVSAPRLGNHLARLRASGLVTVEHRGRHAVYQVLDSGVGDLLATLSRYAQGADSGPRSAREPTAADIAHTCYDHTAGRLGVAVFAMLIELDALRPPDGLGAELALGSRRKPFVDLGVALEDVSVHRRKLATACLDRTHRLPHLGGLLGAAVLEAFLARAYLERQEGTRTLVVTTKGARALPRLLPGFTARSPKP